MLQWNIHRCVCHNFQTCSTVTLRNVTVVVSWLAVGVDVVAGLLAFAVVGLLVCGVFDKVEVVPSLLVVGVDVVVIPDTAVDLLVYGVSDKVEDTNVVVVEKGTMLVIKTCPNVKPTA